MTSIVWLSDVGMRLEIAQREETRAREDLAAAIRLFRASTGLSLRALAAKLHCTHVHLHHLERGIRPPSKKLLDRLVALQRAHFLPGDNE